MSLQSLPALLRDEPALAAVLGRRSAVLAVPEAARPLALAGLARVSGRSPLLVAVPTGTAAQRLADDLQQLLPPEDVELFPAWETLPFERVSPSVEAMGRRLRVLWRLQDDTVGPPAPDRRRRHPGAAPTARPGRRARRARGRPARADARRRGAAGPAGRRRVPPRGAGGAPRRGRSERVDHRRLPVDGGRPRPDRPLGRRGRPADRVLRPRPALDRSRRRGRDHARPRAAADDGGPGAGGAPGRGRAMGPRAVGAPRRGVDVRRDGELAALAGGRRGPADRPPAGHGAGDPRRAQAPQGPGRRRAGGGGRPRHDPGPDVGGRRRRGLPAAPPPGRAAADRRRRRGVVDGRHARLPRHPDRDDAGVGRDAGRRGGHRPPAALAAGRRLPGRRRRRGRGIGGQPVTDPRRPRAGPGVPRRARGEPKGRRAPTTGARAGRRAAHPTGGPDRRRAAAPLDHPPGGAAGRADRGRPDRSPPRPPHPPAAPPPVDERVRGPAGRRLRRPLPPRGRPLRRHGQADDRRRRARLPAAGVQGRRPALRPVRPDRRRPPLRRGRVTLAPPPRRRGLREGQEPRSVRRAGDRPRAGRAVPTAAQRSRLRLRRRHALAARAGGELPLRRDARPARRHPRREGRHGGRLPDGPAAVRRCGVRQDRGGDPRRVQGHPGRQAGRGPGAHHPPRAAARQHLRRPLPGLPDPLSRCSPASSAPLRPRPWWPG